MKSTSATLPPAIVNEPPAAATWPLSETVALIECIKRYDELTEAAGRTEVKVSEMEETINHYVRELELKEKEDGDAFKIGQEMAAFQNGIKILRNRLIPVREQLDRENEAARGACPNAGEVRVAINQYVKALVRIRLAALHALCDRWRPGCEFNAVFDNIAADSADYVPLNGLLSSLPANSGAATDLAPAAVELLTVPLPESPGKWELDVRLDWKVPADGSASVPQS